MSAARYKLAPTVLIDAVPELLEASVRANAEQQSGKVAAELSGHAHWNHLDLVAGIPYVTLQSLIENVHEDAGSGKLGVAWAAGPRTSIRGSVGSFHRAPSLLELFGNRGALRGNPTLRPERATAAEKRVAELEDEVASESELEKKINNLEGQRDELVERLEKVLARIDGALAAAEESDTD